MNDARKKAIEAANKEIAKIMNQLIRCSDASGGAVDTIAIFDVYEAAMLEAGWKMTPMYPTNSVVLKVANRMSVSGHYVVSVWRDIWNAV